MTRPDPSASPSETGPDRIGASGVAGIAVAIAAWAALWLSLASLVPLWRQDIFPFNAPLLSWPLALPMLVAALLLLPMAHATRPRGAWGDGIALGVVVAYALAFFLRDQLPAGGRFQAAIIVTTLLAGAGLLQGWRARQDSGAPPLSHLARWTAALGTLLVVLVTQTLMSQQQLHAEHQARQASHEMVHRTSRGLADGAVWLRRLAQRWSTLAQPPSTNLMNLELRSYLRDFPLFQELAVLDAEQAILSVGLPNLADDRPPLSERALESEILERARQGSHSVRQAAEPVGPNAIESVLLIPVKRGDSPSLMVVATLALHTLLDEAALRAPRGFEFQVLRDGVAAYRTPGWPKPAEVRGRLPLPLDDTPRWQLDYRYQATPVWPLARWLPELLLGLGLALTFCLVTVGQRLHLARRRAAILHHETRHDPLTGLANARQFSVALADTAHPGPSHDTDATAEPTAADDGVAVVLVDLDGVKLINDTLGHPVGDAVIREAARRIEQDTGDLGLVARQSGGEFSVLLRGANLAEADALTGRIVAGLAQPYHLDERVLRLTASAGVASGLPPADDPLRPLREADLAMVRAKQEGRNTWRRYTIELGQQVAERLALRQALQTALDQRRLELYYQPVIDGQSGRIVCLEALLRWQDDSLGELDPARIVLLAEETGQILALSDWILQQACEHARQLQNDGQAGLPISVNISPRYFEREDFVAAFRQALDAASLPPGSLRIEITERLLQQAPGEAAQTLTALRELGIQAALDDFGTGYASLSHLRHLPIDRIKIDGSFVRHVTSDPADAAIVLGTIAMAHHLQLRVVAEGIETEAQFAFLKRHHCDEYQGFLFGRPAPFDTLRRWLDDTGNRLILPELPPELARQRTLLLIDDEPNIVRALVRLLRHDGYRILIAHSPAEAFDVLARQPVQVVLSDQRMPGLSGIEFLRQVKRLYPHTVRLVLSGYADLQTVTDAINHGEIYKFLTKPWDDDALREEIALAFRRYETEVG